MPRWPLLLGLILCLCPLEGCQNKKVVKKVPVSGTVKLDGKPLEDGEVTFPGQPGMIPAVLPIKGGSFSGEIPVGKTKVEIRAFETKKAPASSTGGATEVKENYIPKRFNTETTLEAEVSDSGLNPNTFEVKRQ